MSRFRYCRQHECRRRRCAADRACRPRWHPGCVVQHQVAPGEHDTKVRRHAHHIAEPVAPATEAATARNNDSLAIGRAVKTRRRPSRLVGRWPGKRVRLLPPRRTYSRDGPNRRRDERNPDMQPRLHGESLAPPASTRQPRNALSVDTAGLSPWACPQDRRARPSPPERPPGLPGTPHSSRYGSAPRGSPPACSRC